jgi:hypothetical protein
MTNLIVLTTRLLTGLRSRLRLGSVWVFCTDIFGMLAQLEEAGLRMQVDDCVHARQRRPLAEGWQTISG